MYGGFARSPFILSCQATCSQSRGFWHIWAHARFLGNNGSRFSAGCRSVCMAFDPRCQPVLVLGWQLLLRQLQQKCPRRPALSVTSCGVTGCTWAICLVFYLSILYHANGFQLDCTTHTLVQTRTISSSISDRLILVVQYNGKPIYHEVVPYFRLSFRVCFHSTPAKIGHKLNEFVCCPLLHTTSALQSST